MPIDPADDKPEPTDNSSEVQYMQGTSMAAPYMVMIILQLREFLQQLKRQGISDHSLRVALYALIRVELHKSVGKPPTTEESWHTAIEDVNNFNAVADSLFEAYAKDRSLCREGTSSVLNGDNFSITLSMNCQNSSN